MKGLPGKGLIPIGSKPPLSRLAVGGFILSAIAIVAAMGAGYGTRAGWWDFRQGFGILNGAAYFGIAGTALSIGGAIISRPGRRRRGFILALLGIILGTVAFGVPGNWYVLAKHVPMIHDITTDTENPPQFVAILPLRKDASNPAEYGGPEVAAKQHAAYPDIRPLAVDIPPSKAYEIALDVSRRMMWKIVAGSPSEGRIEAVATTRWFGFKDDVVIRITPVQNGGSIVDVRSESRVGISDIGTNARRIRSFLDAFAIAVKNASLKS
jgi:uncharacterized protein (DUF1499 family)